MLPSTNTIPELEIFAAGEGSIQSKIIVSNGYSVGSICGLVWEVSFRIYLAEQG